MKKILVSFLTILSIACITFASNMQEEALASSTQQEALNFFHSYVNAANTYSPTVTTMYSPHAKIIRQVLKKDGTIVTRETNTQRYIREMKNYQIVAKVRHYKNNYSNIQITKVGTDSYKVSSLRQPSGESYKLKAYMIVTKQPNGKWLITEEMMQSKVQILATAK